MSFRLVPKSMTLNGVMAVVLRYFSEFDRFRSALRKGSRSLSHLMSSCLSIVTCIESAIKTATSLNIMPSVSFC